MERIKNWIKYLFEKLNPLYDSFPWLIPVVTSISLFYLGANTYKNVRNYEFSYNYCEKTISDFETQVVNLNKLFNRELYTLLYEKEIIIKLREAAKKLNDRDIYSITFETIQKLKEQNLNLKKQLFIQIDVILIKIKESNPTSSKEIAELKLLRNNKKLSELYRKDLSNINDMNSMELVKRLNQILSSSFKKDPLIKRKSILFQALNIQRLNMMNDCVKNTSLQFQEND